MIIAIALCLVISYTTCKEITGWYILSGGSFFGIHLRKNGNHISLYKGGSHIAGAPCNQFVFAYPVLLDLPVRIERLAALFLVAFAVLSGSSIYQGQFEIANYFSSTILFVAAFFYIYCRDYHVKKLCRI